MIRARSRRGLITPPSQSRDGTAIAMAIQSRRADRLDVQLVGLDVPQLDLPAQDVMLVEALAVPAGPVPPGGDGPLVEPEGGDDGLQRAAVAEQGQHDGHQRRRSS